MAVVAINRYYKLGPDDDLESYFDGLSTSVGLTDPDRVKTVKKNTNDYVEWLDEAEMFATKTLVRVDWAPDPTEQAVRLGGQISRFDTTQDGYRAVLLAEPHDGWSDELRFPLLQLALSDMFARPTEEVAVGFQSLRNQEFSLQTYSESDLNTAKVQLRDLVARILALSSSE